MSDQVAKRYPDFRKAFAEYLTRLITPIEGRYYRDQTLNIDGYRFVKCRFDNCTLVSSVGVFEFEECIIEGGAGRFGYPAARIIKFWNFLVRSTNEPEGLMPIYHEGEPITPVTIK